MTTTITPKLITSRITVFLWRVFEEGHEDEDAIASGSTNDLELAQEEAGQYGIG